MTVVRCQAPVRPPATALLHGGDLTAHNDGGAVFTLTLPRRPETPTPAPDAL
ncbi:hypothetical protein [Amycolatopsis sp. NPDC003861]